VDFFHKIYAATMNGKGRDGRYMFSHDDWGRDRQEQSIGHMGQLPPRWRRLCSSGLFPLLKNALWTALQTFSSEQICTTLKCSRGC